MRDLLHARLGAKNQGEGSPWYLGTPCTCACFRYLSILREPAIAGSVHGAPLLSHVIDQVQPLPTYEIPNRRMFIVVIALILVFVFAPQMVNEITHGRNALAAIIFLGVCVVFAVVHHKWLMNLTHFWARMIIVLLTWVLALAFTAIFTEQFDNAYLSLVVAVQIIFALQGPRYGLAMIGLSLVAILAEIIGSRSAALSPMLFALSVIMTVGLLTWFFVSNALRAGAEATRLASEVTNLNRLLLTSQEQERRRLARDIHDGPLQSMGVELLAMDRVKRRMEAGEYEKAGVELEYMRQVARETVTDLRDTLNGLRNTLLDSGIEAALQNLARKTQAASAINVQVEVEAISELSDEMSSCLYQLAVEALNNVMKHARANEVYILLQQNYDELQLTVKDNGIGFNYAKALRGAVGMGHIGVHIMKERAAELGGAMQVTSAPEQGTTLFFRFPTPAVMIAESPASPNIEPVYGAISGSSSIIEPAASPMTGLRVLI